MANFVSSYEQHVQFPEADLKFFTKKILKIYLLWHANFVYLMHTSEGKISLKYNFEFN